MNLTFCLVLFLILPNAVLASGCFHGCTDLCTLRVPDNVTKQPEALGNPLMIFIDVKVIGVRDIPDQGGSALLDIRYV